MGTMGGGAGRTLKQEHTHTHLSVLCRPWVMISPSNIHLHHRCQSKVSNTYLSLTHTLTHPNTHTVVSGGEEVMPRACKAVYDQESELQM